MASTALQLRHVAPSVPRANETWTLFGSVINTFSSLKDQERKHTSSSPVKYLRRKIFTISAVYLGGMNTPSYFGSGLFN